MYGVISRWDDTKVEWFDTLSEAFNNADSGDTVVKKLEEIK